MTIRASDTRTVFIRDLIVESRIGVYASEQDGAQRIGVDLEFDVADPGGVGADELGRVVDYSAVIALVRHEAGSRHTRLVETLAERIAESVLADPRILEVRVRIAKLDILPAPGRAGVEITRRRATDPA